MAVQLSRLWGPSPFRGASSVLSTSWSQRWEIFVAVDVESRNFCPLPLLRCLTLEAPISPYKPTISAISTWHLGPVRQSLRRHLTHLFLSQELIRFTFWYWMISMYWVMIKVYLGDFHEASLLARLAAIAWQAAHTSVRSELISGFGSRSSGLSSLSSTVNNLLPLLQCSR